ncbi:hypothetical protein, partial [Wandonia haliotis]|uniref:hypothetical protein n=1 Tax=Wandonia haliotis TaxID=574963 RepID=UPI0031DFB64C
MNRLKLLTALVCLSFGFGIIQAQNPIWTIPPNMNRLMIDPFPTALPTPTDPNNTYDPGEQYYYYQGQEAASTHNSMMDAQGN